MNTRERFVIYSLLTGLLAVNGVVLLGHSGTPAYAAPLVDAPFDEDYSLAFVQLGTILNKQLQGKEYEEERQAIADEFAELDQEYRDRLNDFQTRIQALGQDNPEAQPLLQQGQALLNEYRQWTQSMAAREGEMTGRHLEQAYRELVTAVNIVADRLNIDLVYRFIPVDEPFNAPSAEVATQAIRLRPVLRYPEGLNVTPEVLEELALDAD